MLTFPPVIHAPVPQGFLTPARVAGAIKAAHGILAYAARLLGCSRPTVHKFLREHPICRQAQYEAREELIDHAESKLFEAIDEREGWAVCFYLKCQAKDRGYVQTFQVSPDSAPRIEFRFCVAAPPTFSGGEAGPTIDAEPVRAEVEAEAVPPPADAQNGDSSAEGAAE